MDSTQHSSPSKSQSMFLNTQKSNFTMKGTPVLGGSQMSTTTDFVGNILNSRHQKQQNCNDTTMEDIHDALQIRDTETYVVPQPYAQPNEPQQSMSNNSNVAVDDQELLQLQAAQMFYHALSFKQKQDHLGRVQALLDHHKMIVDVLQGMKDVSVVGLGSHDTNQKIVYSGNAIDEAKNVLYRSQQRQ